MKLIKLTEFKYAREIYLNVEHLVSFWVEDGKTVFNTSNDDCVGYVKETPEEIVQLIKNAKEV